jgi:hypothetical protein
MASERIERDRSVPAAGRRAPADRAAGILALQRSAGNHAVTRVLSRNVVTDAHDQLVGMRCTVGKELTAAFAQEAKRQAGAGRVDAEKLRTAALSSDETVDDYERMFIAALLDVRNVAALKRTAFQQLPDSIEFHAASITPAARAKVANLDRPALKQAVTDEERARDRAAKASDGAGWNKHLQALADQPRGDRRRLSRQGIDRALNDPAPQIESLTLQLIRAGYGMTATPKALEDGFNAESMLDWVGRPRRRRALQHRGDALIAGARRPGTSGRAPAGSAAIAAALERR